MPVTTLGLIDTSIGGKGGINLPGVGRNLLGSFHQRHRDDPRRRPDAAASPKPTAGPRSRRPSSTGSWATKGILSLLESAAGFDVDGPGSEATDLLELVERCALAKRRAVLRDERDTGDIRIALNLGHTLSHALEAATGYRMRHGEAVAYGLRAALEIGTTMGVTPPSVAARADRLLRRLDLGQEPLAVPVAEVLELHRVGQEATGREAALGPRREGRRRGPRRRAADVAGAAISRRPGWHDRRGVRGLLTG